mgnify:CR=1 FL=1
MKILSIFLLVFSFFLFVASGFLYYIFITPVNSFELYSSAIVTNETGIGVDLNSSALTFGMIGQGGSSLRKVILTNDHPFPLMIKVKSFGSISSILSYNSFTYLPPHSNVSVPITAFSPYESTGLYEGKVTFELLHTVNNQDD